TDNVGNVEAAPLAPDCTTEVDLQPPGAVTDMLAMPGHNRIHLSWSAPVYRDAPIEGTLIVRKRWANNAYPEYDDLAPQSPYPAHPADGMVVAFIPGTGPQTYDDEVFTDAIRNVYLYTAFARDEAGNYSLAVASAQDRSTSYWLGDVDEATGAPGVYDGNVDYYDWVVLSDSYNTIEGSSHYEPEMDIGPTDDWSRFGIPLTDNAIDFEDLMVVAMNYGRVDPSGKAVAHVPAGVGSRGALNIHLAVVSEREAGEFADGDAAEDGGDGDGGSGDVGDPVVVELALDGSGTDVRRLSALVTFDPRYLVLIMVEPALAANPDAFFYWTERSAGVIQIDLAVFGEAAVLPAGEPLAVLSFGVASSGSGVVAVEAKRIRGPANERLVCGGGVVDLISAQGAETRTALHQNIPNPFNPRTTIVFEMPAAGRANLTVYDASGRIVARLIERECTAGRQSVEWDGRDGDGRAVGSGVYFYVLETGNARVERKMVLMR
ncbi:T9SS type A sorting domain-containing protein, partial [bacterium]|nr:T9SS type A sorting domain-containing protein [bacterium]